MKCNELWKRCLAIGLSLCIAASGTGSMGPIYSLTAYAAETETNEEDQATDTEASEETEIHAETQTASEGTESSEREVIFETEPEQTQMQEMLTETMPETDEIAMETQTERIIESEAETKAEEKTESEQPVLLDEQQTDSSLGEDTSVTESAVPESENELWIELVETEELLETDLIEMKDLGDEDEDFIDTGLEVDGCHIGLDNDGVFYSIKVMYGENATLEVNATIDDGYTISYQWYDTTGVSISKGKIIPGANQSTYIVENITERQLDYTCVVSDNYGNQIEVDFEIEIDTSSTWLNVDFMKTKTYLQIPFGNSADLEVYVNTYEGAKISYSWEKYTKETGIYEEIDGETESTLHIDSVEQDVIYFCWVEDSVGNSFEVTFNVLIDNGLILYYDDIVYGLPGEEVTLSVDARVYDGDIIFAWSKNQNNGWVEIEDTNSNTLTVMAEDGAHYQCKTTDLYGHEYYAFFYVYTTENLALNYLTYYYAELGQNVTLAVSAATSSDTVTYQWYQIINGIEVIMDGQDKSTLQITQIPKMEQYVCKAVDGNNDTAKANITVYVNSGLTCSYMDGSLSNITALANTNVVLGVTASSDLTDAEKISYTWRKLNQDSLEYEVITEGAGMSTFTVEDIMSYAVYSCKICDLYMEKYVTFVINVTSGFSAVAKESSMTAHYGQAATLEVIVSPEGDENLTYSWFEINENGEDNQLEASESKFTIEKVTKDGTYACQVTDEYEYKIYILFYVHIPKEISQYEISSAMVLKVSETPLVEISTTGQKKYFSVTPERTGKYTFSSMGDEDTYGYLYSSEGYLLDENDNDGENNNFSITYELDAGKTYYLAASLASRSEAGVSFNITLFLNEDTVCNHTWNSGVVTKAATCKEEGIKIYTCTLCGETKTEAIPKLTTHTWNGGAVTKAATCAAAGVKTYTCTVCGATKTESIPKLSTHTWNSGVVTKAATCAATGTRTYTCTVCKATKTETIAKTASHTWGNWTISKVATVSSAAVQVRKCSTCGLSQSRTYGSKLKPTITVTANSLKLKVKQKTTAFKVSGMANGDTVASVKSSNTKILKVSKYTKAGAITLTAQNKTGSAKLTVKLASGLTKTVTVKVQKGTVTTTKISGLTKKITLSKGKKQTLTPVLTPITSQQKVTYTSSNKKVATVSSKGVITAKGAGTAKITVKSGSKKVTVTVTVPKTKTTAITGVPSSLSLKKGKTYKLKAKRTPSNSDQAITYKSSNTKIATVNASGKITAKKKGTVTITVKSGSVSVKCRVTVK